KRPRPRQARARRFKCQPNGNEETLLFLFGSGNFEGFGESFVVEEKRDGIFGLARFAFAAVAAELHANAGDFNLGFGIGLLAGNRAGNLFCLTRQRQLVVRFIGEFRRVLGERFWTVGAAKVDLAAFVVDRRLGIDRFSGNGTSCGNAFLLLVGIGCTDDDRHTDG
ncbi:MAG: hypothetical protein VB875_05435, partial [Pirellulales bacterium]